MERFWILEPRVATRIEKCGGIGTSASGHCRIATDSRCSYRARRGGAVVRGLKSRREVKLSEASVQVDVLEWKRLRKSNGAPALGER